MEGSHQKIHNEARVEYQLLADVELSERFLDEIGRLAELLNSSIVSLLLQLFIIEGFDSLIVDNRLVHEKFLVFLGVFLLPYNWHPLQTFVPSELAISKECR